MIQPREKGGKEKAAPFVSLRWAVGGLLVIGILTRLVGLAREIIIAGTFGTSNGLDAVYLGMAVPIALCLGLGGGFGRAIVPAGASLSQSRLGGLFLVARRRLFKLVIPVALLLMITSPVWSYFLVPGDSEIPSGGVLLAAAFGSLAIIGGSFSGLSAGLSNSQGRHVSAQATPFFHNAIIITCVLLFAEEMGAYALLVGIVLAEYGQVLALTPFLWRITRHIRLPQAHVIKRMDGIFWPAVLLATVAGMLGAVDRFFAAQLPEGGVSALSYAERLLNFPVLLVGLAVQSPLYTRLARFATERRRGSFELTLLLGLRILMLIGAPIGVLVAGFSEPIIAFLLERGAFSASDTAITGMAFRGYAVSVAFLSMLPLLASAGLATGRAWLVVAIYGVSLALNAALDALLVGPFGLLGIAFATSIVAVVTSLAIVGGIAPRLLRVLAFWRTLVTAFLIAAIEAGAILVFRHYAGPMPDSLAGLFLYLAAGGVTAVAVTAFLSWPVATWEFRHLRTLRHRAAAAGGLIGND